MAGDELSIGKTAPSLDTYATGYDSAGIGTSVQTLASQNYDYNQHTVNNTNNQKQFLSLTAQQTTTKPFSKQNLDIQYGNRTGGNPFSTEQSIQERYNKQGIGLNMFEFA